ncbi:unnamed protein product [Nezara viridula]|uniref:Cupin-like domain-containing protein n=1 Tax=Nezara viridula TaxID=85310 RepID=A0A9P0HB46_NEZVI|nr:unnamed protein product [Nezara viridula]
MAPCKEAAAGKSSDLKEHFLFERFINLNAYALSKGLCLHELRNLCHSKKSSFSMKNICLCSYVKIANDFKFLVIVLTLLISLLYFKLPFIDGMMKTAFGIKCILPNNYIVWEATRPIADCSICYNLNSAVILPNITREEFSRYAYSYKPIIIKGAAKHWSAVRTFDYHFFKDLFLNTAGAFESVEEECQFLNFKSDFKNLEDVFNMPLKRIYNEKGTKPWYIGWSNCNREMLKKMRRHYTKPHFLPVDAEHSHVDFIFMGFEEGAFMHLDYISRLMWQAQLRGHKTWHLHPPPECENVCTPISFTVNPGDILLLDTRQWYHKTYVSPGEFSLTVSSEYG